MKAKANEHKIPIRPDPPLARTLFAVVEIGEQIREEHYAAVAAALRFATQMRKKQTSKVYD
jgi:flagellar biosynthetic protein FlhB